MVDPMLSVICTGGRAENRSGIVVPIVGLNRDCFAVLTASTLLV